MAPGTPVLLSLMRVISKGYPLPFASISNSKSFLYVGNLADAILLCCTHPAAAGKLYLVGDSEFISTPELLQRLAKAMGRRV